MLDPQSQQTVSGLYVRTDKCDVSIRGSKTLLDLDDLFAVINGTVRRESTAQEKN